MALKQIDDERRADIAKRRAEAVARTQRKDENEIVRYLRHRDIRDHVRSLDPLMVALH